MISGGKQIIKRGPVGEEVALRNLSYAVLFNSPFVLTSIKLKYVNTSQEDRSFSRE